MNSWNSNYGTSSGFPSANEMNSKPGFGSPALGSGSGLSRPRLLKVRKQTSSHRPRSTPGNNKADLGFNPFGRISDNSIPISSGSENGSLIQGNLNSENVGNEPFLFGADKSNSSSSGIMEGGIVDNLSNLNIIGDKEYANANKETFVFGSGNKKSGSSDGSVFSKLPDEMRKLNIEDLKKADSENNKTQFSFGSDENVAKSFGSSLVTELPNEIKKLNIKDGTDAGGESVNFNASKSKNSAFGRVSKSGDSLFESSQTILDDKLKNLNIKDSIKTNSGGDKIDGNASFSDKSSSFFGATETQLPSKIISDEMKPHRSSDQIFCNSGHSEFTFQAGLQRNSSIEVNPDHYDNDIKVSGTAVRSSLFSSNGIHFQPAMNTFDASSVNQPEKTVNFGVFSKLDGVRTPYVEFNTPTPKENVVSGLNRKLEAKRESTKDARSKKKKGNSRKPAAGKLRHDSKFSLGESSSLEIYDSSDSYSPMDVSPYQETLANNNYSRGTSLTSDEDLHLDNNYSSSELHPIISNDAIDELVAATHRMDINNVDPKFTGVKDEASAYCFDKGVGAEGPSEEYISGAETESFISAAEQFDYSSDTFVTAADSEVSSSSIIERRESDGRTQFAFASNTEDTGSSSFTFAASTSDHGQSAAETHHYKKKNRLKVGHDTYSSMPNETVPHGSSAVQFFPLSGASSLLPLRQGQEGDASSRRGNKSEQVKAQEVKQVTISTSAASIVAQESCEKWRLRGNQAYANGDLSKAEEYYTKGVNCVSQSETANSCRRALMLCYSNRAATLMSLGRTREALQDCMMAAELDPSFLRVQVRAANCYLALGEIDNASIHFMKCLQSGNDVCLDRKLLVEASEGLEKAKVLQNKILYGKLLNLSSKFSILPTRSSLKSPVIWFTRVLPLLTSIEIDKKQVRKCSTSSVMWEKERKKKLQKFRPSQREGELDKGAQLKLLNKVLECMKQSTEILRQRISTDAECALVEIEEALMISSFSEKLQEMKADLLFMLRRYEEVIKFCELNVGSAERNSSMLGLDSKSKNVDGQETQKSSSFRLWSWNLVIKSYFYLGRLDEALDFVKKQEDSVSSTERKGNKTLESVIPLACTIRELLRLKVSGNEAFQSGRYAEAVEHYTAALSCNVESRPFAAICFCNRAAAYQTMGQIAYSIADCNLAIALDGNYVKAISRRATLFEMIRDFGQAAIDLHRLVSVLKKQVEEKGNHYGGSDRMSRVNELKQTQQRLFVIEEEARKEIPLNMYLILGVEPSAATSEIKKAYRKAALKHHPDKAGQSLTRSETGDDGLWKEIAEEVHKDTDRLFKMIGEAYAVLSDSVKRLRYDQEEEMRNGHKRGDGKSTPRTNADVHNYPFERSGSRRQWQEFWRSYGNTQPSESERTRSNWYP